MFCIVYILLSQRVDIDIFLPVQKHVFLTATTCSHAVQAAAPDYQSHYVFDLQATGVQAESNCTYFGQSKYNHTHCYLPLC